MSRACGAVFSDIDIRDYKAVCTTKGYSFPKEFELDTYRVKDQQDVGSCVAHALSSIIEYYNIKQRDDYTEMSTGYIYGNRTNSRHKDPGMVMRDALDIVAKYGDVTKQCFPYNVETPLAIKMYNKQAHDLFEVGLPNRISEYCRITTVWAAKLSLMSGNPLLMAIEWYDDMSLDDNGVLHTNNVGYAGGHCMFIYGWDERGWKVQNSWGEEWGMNGKFILPYNINIPECWSVIDNIIDGACIKKPFKSKAGKIFAKIVNQVCNTLRNK